MRSFYVLILLFFFFHLGIARAFYIENSSWWQASFEEAPTAKIIQEPICLDIDSPSLDSSPNSPKDNYIILAAYNDNELARRLVTKHIRLYTTRKREAFQRWLNRSGMYIDIIKKILKQEGLPEELVYLPIIESGYYPDARSHRKAVGPWQFIKATAKKYGLKINFWVDERRDPEKSTHAAAKYLKDLYKKFGSWHLALAAYNAGEGKIFKAIRRTKSEDFWKIIKTRYIKSETRNYVAKFIAAALIATNPQLYGFDTTKIKKPLKYEKVTIDKPVALKFVAKCIGSSLRTIRQLNPELKQWCTPPDVSSYVLKIPAGTTDKFLQCYKKATSKQRLPMVPYQIKKGDTFAKIAKRYHLKVKAIMALNKRVNPRRLIPGTIVYLPPYR